MGDPVTMLMVGSVGSSLFGAAQGYAASRQAKEEASVAAKAEQVGAISREADRKQALVRAMASQTASAGSRGIAAFEGSPLAVLQEDIEQEEKATERDLFNTKLKQMTLKARGKSQSDQAMYGVGANLLKTGLSTASLLRTPASLTTTKIPAAKGYGATPAGIMS